MNIPTCGGFVASTTPSAIAVVTVRLCAKARSSETVAASTGQPSSRVDRRACVGAGQSGQADNGSRINLCSLICGDSHPVTSSEGSSDAQSMSAAEPTLLPIRSVNRHRSCPLRPQ
jgi:hypothetical protein